MLSPIGTKRGSRHGSCRPRVTISVGSPCRVTVGCGRGRLLVGFRATRSTIGSPLLMPPSMPPCRFVRVPMPCARSAFGLNASLCSLPRRDAADRLAGTGSSAAARVAPTELGVEGEVGVAGSILVGDVAVVLAALVGVAEQNADRRAVGPPLVDARQELRQVLLLALRHQFR